MPSRLACLLLAWAAFLAHPASAHPFLQNRWQVVATPNRLAMSATVTLREVAVIQGLSPAQLAQPAALLHALSNHAAYVSQHLLVSANGTRLPIDVLDYSLRVEDDASGADDEAPERRHAAYELGASLPASPSPLALRFSHDVLKGFNFAPGIPWDVSLVLLVTDPLRKVLGEGVVRIGQDVEVSLPSAGSTSPSPAAPSNPAGNATGPAVAPDPSMPGASVAGFTGFLRHGIHHVATGHDHVLFLASLTLAAASWRRLLAIIGIFTLAHSLTVTLSAMGWLSLPSWIVEPVIAGSIVLVAIQNLVAPSHAAGHGRLLVAFAFGLVHGLGFAGGLADALGAASGWGLALPILAFCLGVELAHLALGAPMFAILKVAARPPVPDPGAPPHPFRRTGSILVAMGGSWFLWAALRNA